MANRENRRSREIWRKRFGEVVVKFGEIARFGDIVVVKFGEIVRFGELMKFGEIARFDDAANKEQGGANNFR